MAVGQYRKDVSFFHLSHTEKDAGRGQDRSGQFVPEEGGKEERDLSSFASDDDVFRTIRTLQAQTAEGEIVRYR